MYVKGAAKAEAKARIIVAIPNDWLQLPVVDMLSARREAYTRAKSLRELYQKVKKYPRCIVIIDIFAYPEQHQDILERLYRENPSISLIPIISEEKLAYARYLDDNASCTIVQKETVDTELIPAIDDAHKDQNLIASVRTYLPQIQLPTLGNKEGNVLKKGEGNILERKFNRRSFLKGAAATAAVAGVAMSGGVNLLSSVADAASGESTKEELFATPCRSNCFQSCFLNAHIRDGKVTKTSMRPYPNDDYSGCCLRGMSLVQRTYSPTRIKYPMRRVGERGADQWERITWDEAIAEIAEKFTSAQEQYGDQAVVVDTGSGNYGLVNGVQGVINRLSYALGATRINVCYDQAIGYGTNRVVGGGVWLMGNEPADLLRAKVIFIWGSNPVYAQPQSWRIIAKAKRGGAKLICIDPIFSATANKSDEFVPITPGTDLLLILSMMKIVIEKDWLDKDYMKFKSTSPYLVRQDNGMLLRRSDVEPDIEPKDEDYYVYDQTLRKVVLSKEMIDPALEGSYTVEGVAVDTSYSLLHARVMENELAYTVEKTGISEEKIYELTDLYANSGASSIYTNYGIDHYENGHLWGVCMALIGVLTGNIARPGCSIGGLYVNSSIGLNYTEMYAGGSNGKTQKGHIPQTFIGEVFRTQQLNGEPYPLKAMLSTSSNSMSNFAQQGQWKTDILPNLEYWAVIDTELTDTARHADLVLPASFWLEVNDLRANYNNPYLTIQNKAIEPLYESKSDLEITNLIAHAMGLGEYFPPMEDTDWIEVLMDLDSLREKNITYERLQKEKVIRTATLDGQPFVRGVNGFPTATGKAEVYCENPVPRTNYGQDISSVWEKERLPYFKPPNEAWNENPLYEKYPLVFIQEHSRFRTHTQWFNVPVLKELEPEPVIKISRKDASDRGIENGDMVEAYNDRGTVVVKAVIDDAINTGVIIMAKGWQINQFKDGGYQELTNTSSDPLACNFAYFDTLVNVRRK